MNKKQTPKIYTDTQTHIEDQETETMEEKKVYFTDICKICLNGDDKNNMISPCLCSGTHKYMHLQCLEECIKHGYKKCSACLQEYKHESIRPIFNQRIETDYVRHSRLRPPAYPIEIPTIVINNYLHRQEVRNREIIYSQPKIKREYKKISRVHRKIRRN